MNAWMYASSDERYCYPGTTILRNRLNLRSQSALDAFETEMTAQRFDEPLPAGRLSVTHYRAIHRHIFQDVYAWAGRYRTIRISKGASMFCYPEHITVQMRTLFASLKAQGFLFGLGAAAFSAKAAHFLAELNAIHPFRDGNGRTQLAFVALLSDQAGWPLDFGRFEPETYIDAIVRSFGGEEALLAAVIREMAVADVE